MSRRMLWWSLPVLAICASASDGACADDAQGHDALIGKLVPANGPDVLNFRGVELHSMTLHPAKPLAEFDVEFGAHATALSADAKALLEAHRADFAAAPNDAGRFVIATPTPDSAPDSARLDSEMRADSIREYLVKKFGVDPARVEIAAGAAGQGSAPADPLRIHVAKFAQ